MKNHIAVYLITGFFTTYFVSPGSAVKCGKWFSNDCLAKTDIRYDLSISNNIEDQSPVNFRQGGFWVGEALNYASNGSVAVPEHVQMPFTGEQSPYGNPILMFLNTTISGSRFYSRNYIIAPPAPMSFCEEPVPSGKINVVAGVCGVNGIASYSESFATTTHEKDGVLHDVVVGLGVGDDIGGQSPEASTAARIPVGTSTIYKFSFGLDGTALFTDTWQFTSDDFSTVNAISDVYTLQNGTATLRYSFRQWFRKVSEREYIEAIQNAYQENNVPPPLQYPVPYAGACLGEIFGLPCPTEEIWCQSDPECSVSPYQEPEGKLRPSIVAGLCIFLALLLIMALFLAHRYVLRRQQKRFRVTFAARVAETISLRPSRRTLTPDVLGKEFAKIDKALGEGDGYISKEELWEFVSSGKAGEMEEHDFNALFAALDVDHNGKVDFLEFCNFLSSCGSEFNEARDRMLLANTKSTSLVHSLKNFATAAQHISASASVAHGLEDVQEQEEEDDGDDGVEPAKTTDVVASNV